MSALLAGFPAPGEVDGFRSHDRIHAPRPLSPLAFELITDTLAIGFTRAHQEVGAPVDMLSQPVNWYLYTSMRPSTDEAELLRRAERYVDLPAVLDRIGDRWEHEWKPWLIDTVRVARRADYRSLSNVELDAELDRQRDHMIEQWRIHGHINFGVVAAARFVDFYNETFTPVDETEAHLLLQGHVTQSVRASQEIWRLSRQVRGSTELRQLFEQTTGAVISTLRGEAAAGAVSGFAVEFEAFLDEYGWRSDAVFDVADATWREDPAIAIDSLRGYVGLADEHDPATAFDNAVTQRESLAARAREQLAGDPDRLSTFERYYRAALPNLVIIEDHAFWIDQSGVANVRRFLLQVGERLVHDGCLDRPDDVFYLQRVEIGQALRERGDWRGHAAARRALVAAAAALEPPRTLGVAPAPAPGELDPLVDAIINRMAGRRAPQPFDAEATVLTGHGASAGTATGIARVVRSLAEAANLDDGDILVCEMTLPPWVPLFAIAAAVVTDTGGLLGHSAIVAREFGIPAVVGTQFGTKLIADGLLVTVDGDTGQVHLHRS